MKSIVVTGGTGFVGSHALEALQDLIHTQQKDVKLIAACRDPKRLPCQVETLIGDMQDSSYLDTICRDTDTLVHTAAWTALYGYKKESEQRYLAPSLALIEAARRAKVKRFVYISSNSAAAPEHSHNAMSKGVQTKFWPHLDNVIKIEDRLREVAHEFESVIILRLGLFVGQRYNLGLLPILLPRLKTHLVPWVNGGNTDMPLIDGRDVGQAIALAATQSNLSGYHAFNIVGSEIPSVREVIEYLHDEYGYPKPHFNVPFAIAYPFAGLMELIDPFVPWEPLVTRSIIHLLENTNTNNQLAEEKLGFKPRHHWKEAIDLQLGEMSMKQTSNMRMHV